MKRQCNRCKEIKDISEFYPDSANSTGYGYKCNPCDYISRKERKLKSPWQNHLASIRKRCNYILHDSYYRYGGRGIKCFLTEEQIKFLWFRDRAYEMKKPSVDRIDNDGNYTFDNCRFMELPKNTSKSVRKTVLQFDLTGNFIKEWESPIVVQNVLGFWNSSIGACARGKYKQAYGFIWKYKVAQPLTNTN